LAFKTSKQVGPKADLSTRYKHYRLVIVIVSVLHAVPVFIVRLHRNGSGPVVVFVLGLLYLSQILLLVLQAPCQIEKILVFQRFIVFECSERALLPDHLLLMGTFGCYPGNT